MAVARQAYNSRCRCTRSAPARGARVGRRRGHPVRVEREVRTPAPLLCPTVAAGGSGARHLAASPPRTPQLRQRQRVDPVPEQAEQRGQQGQRGDHHHADRDRARDAHGADERDAGEAQPEDRHDHGAAREDDGVPRDGRGVPGGVGGRVARGELGPEPAQDEQCVVDARAEPQHHGDDRRRGGDGDDGAHQQHQRRAGHDADGGDDGRQPRGDQRAERDDEHNQRGTDADEFGCAGGGLGAQVDDHAAELDVEPGRPGPLGGLVKSLVVRRVQVAQFLVVADGRGGGLAVGARQRLVHLADVGLLLDVGQHLPHGGGALGIVQRAVRRPPHDLRVHGAEGGEVVPRGVRGLLRLHARHPEVVDEGAARRLPDGEQGDRRDQPGTDRAPGADSTDRKSVV